MNALADKVAIVAGASSGIGRATAKLFAEEAAKVVVGTRRRAELDALVDEIETAGGTAIALAGDVRDEAFARALVETALGRFGGLDVTFNNAGSLGEMGPTPEVSLAGWNEAIETNLTSAFLAAKHQLPAMLQRGRGSLIFTSTFVGHTTGMPGVAAYAASKAGLIGLTQALAVEFGPRGIRVNAILPGGTDTPMARAMNGTPEALAFVRSLHALKRMASPDEQARSVLYLASDASSFTTGTALLVDGGVSINRTLRGPSGGQPQGLGMAIPFNPRVNCASYAGNSIRAGWRPPCRSSSSTSASSTPGPTGSTSAITTTAPG